MSMIQDRIKKALRVFCSVYAFQGCLSPLLLSLIVQCCVLLYEIENWMLSSESFKILECFQGVLAKRILKHPQWYIFIFQLSSMRQDLYALKVYH